MRKLTLQCFYISLAVFNFSYKIFFLWSIRYFLLKVTGSKIGKNSSIQTVKFFGFGKLIIGDNTIVNSGCYLDNRRGIYLGNYVVIAHDTKIYTLGHDYNDHKFSTKGAPVNIEDYVIVFANVLIMPGVTIKKGSVILPGSVVSKDVEEMSVVGGNPAKLIKMRESLHHDKPSFRYWLSI